VIDVGAHEPFFDDRPAPAREHYQSTNLLATWPAAQRDDKHSCEQIRREDGQLQFSPPRRRLHREP